VLTGTGQHLAMSTKSVSTGLEGVGKNEIVEQAGVSEIVAVFCVATAAA
jgi:hypothetical protein